jgi:hypothetical protein
MLSRLRDHDVYGDGLFWIRSGAAPAARASGGVAPRSEEKDASVSDGGMDLLRRPVLDTRERYGASASGVGVGPHAE